MFIKRLFLMLGLCVLIAGCSTGKSSYGLKFHEKETDAQLGERYLLGRGVPQNDAKAFAYFSDAAKDDDPFAQNELAFLYASGRGTPKNYNKAFEWYKKAANHGLASAQYNLGLLYLHGLGTPPNQALALQWFEKSASHGFEPARIALNKYRS